MQAGSSWFVARQSLIAVLVLTGTFAAAAHSRQAENPKVESVRLTIDYGDGVELSYQQLPWRKGLTVLDVLLAAEKHPRPLKFRYRGSGATAFVEEIAGQANQGGAEDSRNWMFSVNSKRADEGCGTFALQPGDQVVWKFETP